MYVKIAELPKKIRVARESLEKEVAIDPEMLGKVFVNLLPENTRKGNGAFYTPREIVHYMCQKSLINYLYNRLNIKTVELSSEKSRATNFAQNKENRNFSLGSSFCNCF